MSAMAWVLLVGASIAAMALAMTLRNLRLYRPAPGLEEARRTIGDSPPRVTVCIPARNEEANLEACIRSVLGKDGPEGSYPNLSVLVYDDQSEDATPAVLARLAAADPRVRPVMTHGGSPPAGWNGKQWACDVMGRQAAAERAQWLLFTDADVRFEPGAVWRAVAEAMRADREKNEAGVDIGLLSTFPRQLTGSMGEALLVPMIHFILLSYLPFDRMRATNDPATSAGCGQFLLVRGDAYLAAGGHAACRDSMHDGIKLPRAVRRAGFRTDLFDGTDLAWCRMYRGGAAAWRGFAKNAFEGVGSVPLLAVMTVVHLLGHVLPWAYLALAVVNGGDDRVAVGLAGLAVVCSLVQRGALADRFLQSPVGAALHPVGVVAMTLVQWHSLYLTITGKRAWRGRTGVEVAVE